MSDRSDWIHNALDQPVRNDPPVGVIYAVGGFDALAQQCIATRAVTILRRQPIKQPGAISITVPILWRDRYIMRAVVFNALLHLCALALLLVGEDNKADADKPLDKSFAGNSKTVRCALDPLRAVSGHEN
jgi:hypothetical protein